MLRRSRHPGPKLGAGQLATAWQVVSLLLEYPTEELLGRRPLLADAAAGLPAPVREPVSQFLTTLETAPLGQLQRDYVETFDVTRRCCLYLTYFAHGDTRKAGVELEAAELPDHLSVVLEFGASYDAETAWRLLNDHRAGIEMLRIALAEKGSPWHVLMLALGATLPELKGEDEDKMLALIAQGPPAEEVGLDLQPYALDPRLNPRPSDSVDLGETIPVGAP